MRGVIFTEFLDYVAASSGEDAVDRMLDACPLASGGAYTSVGRYDHKEMLTLVGYLSEQTGLPAGELCHVFGAHLFGRFADRYARFFRPGDTALDFLARVETHIHTEVRKLYPDAELPQFDCERPDGDTLVMTYRSTRPMADCAHGLIDGTIAYFGETIDVARQDLPGEPKTQARFTLKRRA
ncbi:MAG: heme NO-binding domain-containing protein [Geminicoccaceae bacterium]